MGHGLNLITLLFIFMFVFALISGKAIKPKKKVVYIEKPYIVEKEVIKEVIKEIIKEVPLGCDTIIKPTGFPVLAGVLTKPIHRMSGFGYRLHPVLRKIKLHAGIDMGCKIGSDVITTANGKIVLVQYSNTGYGNNIVVEHSDKYRTRYAHLSKIAVKVNQKVVKGQVIGYSGNTGMSTSPHVHYEVIVDNKKVDPVLYF